MKLAAIRHVNQVDAGHHRERCAEDMVRAADAGRGHIDLSRISLGIGDELGDRFGRR